jgi:hypothetical protein
MASAAIMAASAGLAHAQAPANQMQGQMAAPYGAGGNTTNNNNGWGTANTPSGSAAAGPLSTIRAPNTYAVPSPGTVVIHLNGRVEADAVANFSTADKYTPAPGAGAYKVNPVGVASDVRVYMGADGLATNGIRYGAAVEFWQNWGLATTNQSLTGAGTSGSGNSSAQTLFVRKEFAYLAADNVGILRVGGGEGVIGIMDPCIFSSQCWDAGIGTLNGGGSVPIGPNAISIPWVFSSQSGAEYATDKITYLSPQLYGFDAAFNYVPNKGNIYQASDQGNPYQGAACFAANPGCVALTSGNDSSRFINMFGFALRYQQSFGAVDFKAYGLYELSGKSSLSSQAYQTPAGSLATRGGLGAQFLHYQDFGFYEGGVAATVANLTFAANYMGGKVNGQLGLDPSGGVNLNAYVVGVTYANGPLVLGLMYENVQSQGDARLTGLSQRVDNGLAFGGNYKLAPGMQLVAEYQYETRHQGGFNFNNPSGGTIGSTSDARGQGVLTGLVMNW